MKSHRWILIAEDNPHDAEMTVGALSAAGTRAEIALAQDGEEALDRVFGRGTVPEKPAEPPLLVLLDLKMPKVDGFQTLAKMRADARFKSVPVVIFSSSREEKDVARAYELGANAFVVKPMEFKDYAAALNLIAAFWLKLNEPPVRPSVARHAGHHPAAHATHGRH